VLTYILARSIHKSFSVYDTRMGDFLIPFLTGSSFVIYPYSKYNCHKPVKLKYQKQEE
jgi:hypothetical protein